VHIGFAYWLRAARREPKRLRSERSVSTADAALRPQQLSMQQGQVQQFTLARRGDIDGLMLSDSTEVKRPARLSTAMADAIKPGSQSQ
jgi:hypothetical protein